MFWPNKAVLVSIFRYMCLNTLWAIDANKYFAALTAHVTLSILVISLFEEPVAD